ncbi:unnamed protein product [Miscanthus lutarioriparius]|uniref:Uncharacterized protein n=1 Tax=Miscanthus lutarioriparius TaxID=422564 RepID=A0A811S023_9POAL|nr:unnamed protein product [Miscanthus lutarioriparius]
MQRRLIPGPPGGGVLGSAPRLRGGGGEGRQQRQVVGAAAGVVGKGRLPGGASAGTCRAGRGGAEAVRGVMTEEKARELRARMAQTESFHDAMYHSAIASRLARSA